MAAGPCGLPAEKSTIESVGVLASDDQTEKGVATVVATPFFIANTTDCCGKLCKWPFDEELTLEKLLEGNGAGYY